MTMVASFARPGLANPVTTPQAVLGDVAVFSAFSRKTDNYYFYIRSVGMRRVGPKLD